MLVGQDDGVHELDLTELRPFLEGGANSDSVGKKDWPKGANQEDPLYIHDPWAATHPSPRHPSPRLHGDLQNEGG